MEHDSLQECIQGWKLSDDADEQRQVEALLEPLIVSRVLPDGHRSTGTAILLGEQYHLGGAEDTRRMAQLAGITADDTVVDLACYVGGPARQLAREFGCCVTGVDLSPVHIAIAQRLSELTGLVGQELASGPSTLTAGQKTSFCPTGGAGCTRFICASADAVPVADGVFSVAWSQGSFPPDLRWLPEIRRLLRPGGRLAITLLIRRFARTDSDEPSLSEVTEKIAASGFRVTHAEDISDLDLEYGWLPARRKLVENEGRYRPLLGDDWVREAYQHLDADIAAWREGRAGNCRCVAVRGG